MPGVWQKKLDEKGEIERRCGRMNGFIEWCIIASAFVGYVNFAFLVIVDNKLREIKRETSSLKKEKGGVTDTNVGSKTDKGGGEE